MPAAALRSSGCYAAGHRSTSTYAEGECRASQYAHHCFAQSRRTATSVRRRCQGLPSTIRRRAERAGYDPTLIAQLGGHSLRSGFVTQAFRNGADAHAIMRQTGHTTPAMLERYARENAPLIGNAVNEIGL